MSCIDNIVGMRSVCNQPETESLSGYFFTDYPGITIKSASQFNDEKTITGYNYLLDVRQRAMKRLQSDILAFIATNYRVNSIPAENWNSGKYKTNVLPIGSVGALRGIVAYKQRPQCRFYKIVLSKVRILLDNTGPVTLTINDTGGYQYTTTVSVTAGVVKELILNKTIVGNEVQILIPSTNKPYSTGVNCGVGCGNTPTNTCVRVNGVSNGNLNTSEGFGISADFLCKCDLSEIVCDLATLGLIGQAAYELCGAMFYEEAIMNGRLNYLTIYKDEQLKEQRDVAYSRYQGYLENAMNGIRRYLIENDGNCKCVDCSGAVIKSSI